MPHNNNNNKCRQSRIPCIIYANVYWNKRKTQLRKYISVFDCGLWVYYI